MAKNNNNIDICAARNNQLFFVLFYHYYLNDLTYQFPSPKVYLVRNMYY